MMEKKGLIGSSMANFLIDEVEPPEPRVFMKIKEGDRIQEENLQRFKRSCSDTIT